MPQCTAICLPRPTRIGRVLGLVAACMAWPCAAAQLHNHPRLPLPWQAAPQTQTWNVHLLWTFDVMDTVRGGVAHGWKAPLLLDLRIVRTQRLQDGLRSRLRFDFIRIAGSNPSRDAGDVQGLDNLAAQHAWRVYRAFWQLRDPIAHWNLRLGWQGYDEIFDVTPDGNDLINSSFGDAPTGSQAGFPIWPHSGLGASVLWHPRRWYLRAGLWDGVPRDPQVGNGLNLPRRGDGTLRALESGLWRRGHYKLALGWWSLTRPSAQDGAHQGDYAIADATLLRGAGGQRIGAFVQWGDTRPYDSAVGHYLGAGLRWRLPQWHSSFSTGIARAAMAPVFRRQHPRTPAAETAWEATWLWRVCPSLLLQPDLQYIAHPALAPQARDALVVGLRVAGVF